MRRKSVRLGIAVIAGAVASVSYAQPVPVQRNDVAYGLSRNAPAETLHLVRGFPTGTRQPNEWAANFIQSTQFDNLDGFRHAHFGNLLGVNFGVVATGGIIYNMDTRFTSGTNPGAHQQIFDFATYNANNPGSPLTISRLNAISVSPNNNRIAVTGNDTGMTYVFDYTPGDSMGGGATLTNGREIVNLSTAATTGTAWLDNDNVLALDPLGVLQKVTIGAGGALSSQTVANVTLPGSGNNPFSTLVYEPTISPFVYAASGKFDGTNSISSLVVLDPNNNFSVVRAIDISASTNTMREMAFDSKGNMILGHFVNTTSAPPGESIDIILDAVNAGSLTDNSALSYYTQNPVLSAQFSGLDVASTQLDYKTSGVTVDVRDRQHVQNYFQANPVQDVRLRVQAGYNGGSWNGVGIKSSNAAAQPGYGVGYADAADVGLVGGTFGGETVTGNAILFRLTRYGDANLDGNVNLNDFNRLAANFGQNNRVWSQGDFNYDGLVNLQDFNALAANFGLTAGPDGPTPDDWAALAAAIPEPAGLGMIVAAGVALLSRRRRSA
jgi:hypothetical protein